MPPKRKASQATSSRGLVMKAAQDPIAITDDGEDLSLGDLISSRSTKKPRMARSRAVTKLNALDESDVVRAEPAPKPRKASARAALKQQNRNGASSEEEDDANLEPTTVEQSLLKQNKASKHYLQNFKNELIRSQDEAHKSLVALKRDLLEGSTASGDDVMSNIRSVLQLLPATTSSPNNNPVVKQARKILKLSQSLLSTHHAMVKATNRPHLMKTFRGMEQDREKMAKLLLYGKKEGMKIVERMIDPYSSQKTHQRSGGGKSKAKQEDLAEVLFSKTRRLAEKQQTWGVFARKQLQDLVGIIDT